MPCLQNRVMDVLFLKIEQTNMVPTSQLKLIYKNTVPGSLLRKSMVDVTAYRVVDFEKFMQNNEEDERWPHEALIDLVKALGAKKKEEVGVYKLPEANIHKCYYHVHKDGEQCWWKPAKTSLPAYYSLSPIAAKMHDTFATEVVSREILQLRLSPWPDPCLESDCAFRRCIIILVVALEKRSIVR